MKIGIVTVHDSANYGSFLQAYALYHVLKKWGHEVYFIRTREKEYIDNIFCPKTGKKNWLMHPVREMKRKKQNDEKYRQFKLEWEEFKVLEKWDDIKLDKIILGSDEIWNVTAEVFRREIFYGMGMKDVITYAVSVGAARTADLQKFPHLVGAIKALDTFLVRDINTQVLVKELTGKEAKMVCDPTFLLPVNSYVSKSKLPARKGTERYMVVYSYAFKEEFKNNIVRFARENNLKIVAACMNFDWCDEFVNASPMKFCELLHDAEYVVTTTFHGTIFSFLNHKKFVSAPFSPKVNDVLEKVGLKEAIIKEDIAYEDFSEKLLDCKYDYNLVEERIQEWRNRSLNYLQEALQE